MKARRARPVGLLTTVLFGSLLLTSCSKESTSTSPSHDAPKFGHSFNVIVGVSGESYRLDGYSAYEESKSQAFSPGAVLVVGVKEGVDIRGTRFDYGAVVVAEGNNAQPAFRLARPQDAIALMNDVTIFGQKYNKGAFTVPSGGHLAPDITKPSVVTGSLSDVPASDSSPVWAKIILDQELFPSGAIWETMEELHREAKALGMGGGSAKNPFGIGGFDKAHVSVAALSTKYGGGEIEVSSSAGNDKDVTYHIYGQIAFGIKPGENYFSWLRTEVRFFEDGFVKTARMAQTQPK